MNSLRNNGRLLSILLLGTLVAACGGGGSGGGSSSSDTLIYRVELTNLTNDQPLSPVAVVLHTTGFTAFSVGSAASDGLERLAEGGNTGAFVTAANANSGVIAVKTTSTGIAPGATATVSFSILGRQRSGLRISLVSMLTNTNDGFTGIDSLGIAGLNAGQETEITSDAFDAGTEANTETAATVPGQGGTGYTPTRDDPTSVVTLHPGVVSQDDGLTTSDLTQDHRFDNPVLEIKVRRTQ